MGTCQEAFLYCQQQASAFSSQQASFVRDLQASSLAKRKFKLYFLIPYFLLIQLLIPLASQLPIPSQLLAPLQIMLHHLISLFHFQVAHTSLSSSLLNRTEHFLEKAYQKKFSKSDLFFFNSHSYIFIHIFVTKICE